MKKTKILLIFIIFCITSSSALFLFAAFAQIPEVDVDQATREIDRSVREEAEKKIERPPKKVPEIKEEEKEEEEEIEGPKFFVKTIKLEGVKSIALKELRPIVEKYENRKVTLGELKTLAKEIEREYLKRGIIAACFVPPQDVKDGVVVLRVVEAKMGALKVDEHKYFGKDRIAYYWHTKPGEVLRYDEMSRDLQRMNKNPDRDVNATLHAGAKPGTTDVLIEADTRFPVHPFFTFDTEGSRSTGKARTGFGVKHNNFLLCDDTLLVGYTFGKDFSGTYAYHSIPITNVGTSLFYGYSDSKAIPKKEFSQFDIRSRSQSVSFFLHQDIFKKDEYLGEFSLGLDAKDKTSTANTGTINRDRLRILRISTNLIHKFAGTVTYINPQFSQGLNLFGARRKSGFSSRSAENTFTKFNLGIRHRRALPLNLQVNLNLKYQFASERLTPLEQYSLGGLDSVRGYPSGDYLADNAVQTNVELLIPAFFIPEYLKLPKAERSLKDNITGVLFFDQGYGEKRGVLTTEKTRASLASVGAGLRMRLYNKAVLRLEWGFPVGDKPLTETANSRFHISLNVEF
ncbi:MAG: ShlB/FhaC/HecB family hemolysin secretion/activation protein [Candidatus Omnitrophota bacterium]